MFVQGSEAALQATQFILEVVKREPFIPTALSCHFRLLEEAVSRGALGPTFCVLLSAAASPSEGSSQNAPSRWPWHVSSGSGIPKQGQHSGASPAVHQDHGVWGDVLRQGGGAPPRPGARPATCQLLHPVRASPSFLHIALVLTFYS